MTNWRNKLQDLGLKITPQRLLVLEIMAEMGDEAHPDADQIWTRITARQPEVTKATVYRILKTLVGHGVVNELYLRDGRSRYELNEDHHHHFVCLACKATEKIGVCTMPILDLGPEPRRIVSHSLEIFGYCNACNQLYEGSLKHA